MKFVVQMLVQAQLIKSPTVMYTPVAPTKSPQSTAPVHSLNGAFVTTGWNKSLITSNRTVLSSCISFKSKILY